MRICAAEALRSPKLPLLSAGSFADMTRVANSSPELWRDICLSNRDAILSAIDSYIDELKYARNIIESESPEEIVRFFDEAASEKRDWKKSI
jgi:prephenate dehydrogenase